MQIRLDKYLADMGIGTRSEVKQYIRRKQVQVNGDTAADAGRKVDTDRDQVSFQGNEIPYAEKEYYLFYKPQGCVSAVTDGRHKTVLDYITGSRCKDLFPVGRLDMDTEGLLLITNDGALSHRLLSPACHVPKVYYARVSGEVTGEDAAHFWEGVDIGDEEPTLPARLTVLPRHGGGNGSAGEDAQVTEIELTITEGRFHQVKRMFAAVGKKVLYLKRISMGSLALDESLEPGGYRPLTEQEVQDLYAPTDWRIP